MLGSNTVLPRSGLQNRAWSKVWSNCAPEGLQKRLRAPSNPLETHVFVCLVLGCLTEGL
jgi:hypothetical protein